MSMGRDTSVGGEGAGSEQCLGEEAPDGNWTIPFSTWRRFFFSFVVRGLDIGAE
jgi:hypothetical protein